MRKICSLLALLLVISVSPGQTKDGFKGFAWGTPFESMKNKFHLKLDRNDHHGKKHYSSNVTDMGGIPVKCFFYFYKNKFFTARIDTKGRPNSRALLKMWQELHGNGFQQDQAEEFYMWEKIDNDTKAVYTERGPGKTTVLSISSISIQNRVDQDEKQAVRKGKSDF